MRCLIVVVALIGVCTTTFARVSTRVEDGRTPQLFCGSSKSSSGTSLDGDEITYFATINNISGPFSVHLFMKRVDCSPSCDPSVLSIFAADGKVNYPMLAYCTCTSYHPAGISPRPSVSTQRRPGNYYGCNSQGWRDAV